MLLSCICVTGASKLALCSKLWKKACTVVTSLGIFSLCSAQENEYAVVTLDRYTTVRPGILSTSLSQISADHANHAGHVQEEMPTESCCFENPRYCVKPSTRKWGEEKTFFFFVATDFMQCICWCACASFVTNSNPPKFLWVECRAKNQVVWQDV